MTEVDVPLVIFRSSATTEQITAVAHFTELASRMHEQQVLSDIINVDLQGAGNNEVTQLTPSSGDQTTAILAAWGDINRLGAATQVEEFDNTTEIYIANNGEVKELLGQIQTARDRGDRELEADLRDQILKCRFAIFGGRVATVGVAEVIESPAA